MASLKLSCVHPVELESQGFSIRDAWSLDSRLEMEGEPQSIFRLHLWDLAFGALWRSSLSFVSSDFLNTFPQLLQTDSCDCALLPHIQQMMSPSPCTEPSPQSVPCSWLACSIDLSHLRGLLVL